MLGIFNVPNKKYDFTKKQIVINIKTNNTFSQEFNFLVNLCWYTRVVNVILVFM